MAAPEAADDPDSSPSDDSNSNLTGLDMAVRDVNEFEALRGATDASRVAAFLREVSGGDESHWDVSDVSGVRAGISRVQRRDSAQDPTTRGHQASPGTEEAPCAESTDHGGNTGPGVTDHFAPHVLDTDQRPDHVGPTTTASLPGPSQDAEPVMNVHLSPIPPPWSRAKVRLALEKTFGKVTAIDFAQPTPAAADPVDSPQVRGVLFRCGRWSLESAQVDKLTINGETVRVLGSYLNESLVKTGSQPSSGVAKKVPRGPKKKQKKQAAKAVRAKRQSGQPKGSLSVSAQPVVADEFLALQSGKVYGAMRSSVAMASSLQGGLPDKVLRSSRHKALTKLLEETQRAVSECMKGFCPHLEGGQSQ